MVRRHALTGRVSWAALSWALVAIAVVLRLIRYADNRSLWLDEASLTLNIIDRSLRELVDGALVYQQSAPVGFLAVEKGAVGLLGDNELALRLFPLLAGIAALVLFQRIAARLLPPPVVALVVGLFAISEPLVYYSAEVKPYSSDVAIAAGLALLYLRFADGDVRDPRRLLPLAVAGSIAVWFSFPVVFVLAGIGVAILVSTRDHWHLRGLTTAAAVGAAWVVSFAISYSISSKSIASVSGAYFRPFEGTDHVLLRRFSRTAHLSWSSVVDPGGFPHVTNWLAAPVIAVGIGWLLLRGRPALAALLLVPGLAAFVAGGLGKYPPAGRYWLFLVPLGFIVLGYGVTALVRLSPRPAFVAVPLVVLLTAAMTLRAVDRAADPPRSEDVKPLLRDLAHDWRAGDVLYIYSKSQFAVRYYDECDTCDVRGPFPWPIVLAPANDPQGRALESKPGSVLIGDERRIVADMKSLAGKPRVWLLFSSVVPEHGALDDQIALRELDRLGRQRLAIHRQNAALYLFDLSRGAGS